MLVLHLAATVVFPIMALIAIGWWMERVFELDVATLVRLNFWVFVPALALVKLIEAPLKPGDLGLISGFAIAQVALMALAGFMAGLLPGMRGRRRVLVLGSFAYNIGNYGIPMVTFAFGERWLGIVIALLMVQNVALFTLGPMILGRGRGWPGTLIGLFRTPVVIAVGVALAVRYSGARVPEPIMSVLGPLANGLVPLALLTLGVQMSRTPLIGRGPTTAMLVVLRLLVAPAVSWVLAGAMGLESIRTLLTVCSALPVAVNVFVLCSEYGEDAEDAARAVLWTTVVGTCLLPVLIAWLPPMGPG